MLRIHHFSFAFVVCALLSVLALSSGPAKADRLDAGARHSCAIGVGGTVKCWGRNYYGQLGNGTTSFSTVPTDVVGITGATAVTAGAGHSCAIVADGAVKCWGYNGGGSLGDGTTTDRLTPVRVVGIGDVTAIAAGGNHTCAIIRGGAVYCWGGMFSLGNGTADSSAVPVAVSGIGDASAIVAGYSHTCAVVGTGTVKCWGYDVFDEYETSVPQVVPDIDGVTSISSAGYEVCALLAHGSMICWRHSNYEVPIEPTPVSGITEAVVHTPGCAVLSGGTVKCWYGYGVISDSPNENEDIEPFDVPGARGAIALSASFSHVCARFPDNSIRCWGYAGYLGNGVDSRRDVPVVVTGVDDAVGVVEVGSWLSSAAYVPPDSCALLADGAVTCWGLDRRGNSAMPELRSVSGLSDVTALSSGWFGLCAITGSGAVDCRGTLDIDAGFERVPELDDARILAVGDAHACAIVDGGSVRCWGRDSAGQLGNGYDDNDFSDVPLNVVGIDDAIDLALGWQDSCAVTNAGKLKCWGTRILGGFTDYEPREIAAVSSAVAVATSMYWSCVVIEDGTVGCNNSQTPFAAIPGIQGAVDVALGTFDGCALVNDGTVVCWPMDRGYLDGEDGPVPQPVFGITGATAISAKQFTTCAVVDGGVRCWGAKDYGILGDGSSTAFSVPQPVLGTPFSRTTDLQVFAETGALSNASISPFSVQVNRSAAAQGGTVHLTATVSPALVDPVWNCVATGLADCPIPNGVAGNLDLEFALPPSGDVLFRLLATIDASRGATAAVSAHLEDAGSTNAFPAIDRDLALPVVGGVDDGDRRRFPGACSGTDSPRHAGCEAARVNRSILQHHGRR